LADVVFDMTGHAAVFAGALKLLRKRGRLVLIGDTGTPSGQSLTHDVITKDLRIIGAHAPNAPQVSTSHAPWTHARMVAVFFDLLTRGLMSVDDLISHRFGFTDAPKAYELLTTRRAEAMGVVLEF
jgi:threonine dehydrogenase-like Zn-dependent dehydrogenase